MRFSIARVPPGIPYSRSPSFRCRPPAVGRQRRVASLPSRLSPRCRAVRIYCRMSTAPVPEVDRRSTASPTRSDPSCLSARRRSKCPSLDRRVCGNRATRPSRACDRDEISLMILKTLMILFHI